MEILRKLKSTIKLSDLFYKNSFYSIREIPLSFRFSILVARRVYRKIGYKILKKKILKIIVNLEKFMFQTLKKYLETILSIFDLIKLLFIK